jgi:hypothetical protein
MSSHNTTQPSALDLATLASAFGGNRSFIQPTQEQIKRQNIVKAGAGIADMIAGRRAQNMAEQQIEDLGGQQEALVQQYRDLSAPGLMDPNTVAAATRNAAILGGVPAQSDASAEMAAAKMAMESGVDPATIQRNLAQAQMQEQQMASQQAQQAFQQGLGMAQQDAQNQFAKQQENLMMDIDNVSSSLEAAQRESLMAQQRSQQGMSNLVGAGTTLGLGALQNRKKKNTTDPNDTTLDSTSFQIPGLGEGANAAYNALNYQFGQGLNENPFAGPSLRPGLMGTTRIPRVDTEEETNSQEQGGVVQKTPGEFDHDTNDMILMAPTADGLVDTGIRQTGGEFVLNPEQAEGLEDAYDAVDPRNPTFDQLLALYEAARFLEEPQFDDDYAA